MRNIRPLALGVSADCRLIGLGIGAAIDSGHKGPERVEGWELERIKPGKAIRAVFRNGGSTIDGLRECRPIGGHPF